MKFPCIYYTHAEFDHCFEPATKNDVAGPGFDTGLKRTAVLRRQSSVSAGATFNHS